MTAITPPPQTHEGVQQSDKRRRSHDADFGCDVVGQSVDHLAQVSNDKSQHHGNGGAKKELASSRCPRDSFTHRLTHVVRQYLAFAPGVIRDVLGADYSV